MLTCRYTQYTQRGLLWGTAKPMNSKKRTSLNRNFVDGVDFEKSG